MASDALINMISPSMAPAGATSVRGFFCGSCRHQQFDTAGEQCELCAGPLVSWDHAQESEYTARKRWLRWYGKSRVMAY